MSLQPTEVLGLDMSRFSQGHPIRVAANLIIIVIVVFAIIQINKIMKPRGKICHYK